MLFQTLLSPETASVLKIDEVAIVDGVFKTLFLLSVIFYVIFAVIVIRQVQIMKNTLITPVSPALLFVSVVHLLVAVGIFFFFLVLL